MAPSVVTNTKNKLPSGKKTADKFNIFFTNIGEEIHKNIKTDTNFLLPNLNLSSKPDCTFSIRDSTEADIVSIINKIPDSKSSGIDGIPSTLIKAAAPSIGGPLSNFINKIIHLKQIPVQLKSAVVTPILKSGNHDEPSNYRPISILPAIAKIFEKFIANQINDYLEGNNLLNPSQHGFRKHHSTTTNLILLTEELRSAMDDKRATGILSLDLSKAFDCIDHSILLHKLTHLGFNNDIINLLTNYLNSRSQMVKLENTFSDPLEMKCGVPQGSVLGPILFNIYINDLPRVLKFSQMSMFADDSTTYYSHHNPKAIEEHLNSDLLAIKHWLIAHKLKLNVIKTKFCIVGTAQQLPRYKNICIVIDDHSIPHSSKFKLLGVIIDSNLTWDDQIKHLLRSCKFALRAFRRGTNHMDIDSKKMLYNAAIASRLNYADVVWSQCNIQMSNKLQTIQNIAARHILNRDPLSSAKPLLKNLNWLPLALKRKVHTAVAIFKMMNNLAPLVLTSRLKNLNHNITTRGKSGNNQYIKRTQTTQMKKSFFTLAPKIWNEIPNNVRDSPSWHSFKIQLSKHYINS